MVRYYITETEHNQKLVKELLREDCFSSKFKRYLTNGFIASTVLVFSGLPSLICGNKSEAETKTYTPSKMESVNFPNLDRLSIENYFSELKSSDEITLKEVSKPYCEQTFLAPEEKIRVPIQDKKEKTKKRQVSKNLDEMVELETGVSQIQENEKEIEKLFPRSQEFLDKYTHPESRENADIQKRHKSIRKYNRTIESAAKKYGVDSNLVKAIIIHESSGNHNCISSVGAEGMMQMMPGTANYLGCLNYQSINGNIDCGVKYLAKIYRNLKADFPNFSEQDIIALTLRAYNQGEGGLRKYLKEVMPVEDFDEFVDKRINLKKDNKEYEGEYDYVYKILATQELLDQKYNQNFQSIKKRLDQ